MTICPSLALVRTENLTYLLRVWRLRKIPGNSCSHAHLLGRKLELGIAVFSSCRLLVYYTLSNAWVSDSEVGLYAGCIADKCRIIVLLPNQNGYRFSFPPSPKIFGLPAKRFPPPPPGPP